MDDGSVVLASKDYRLYIYRYVQVSEKFEFEFELILFVLWEVCILSHFVLIYRCRLSGCEFCDATTAAAEGGNLF